jgi:hypothetical protein
MSAETTVEARAIFCANSPVALLVEVTVISSITWLGPTLSSCAYIFETVKVKKAKKRTYKQVKCIRNFI